jgi:hypothetical protein
MAMLLLTALAMIAVTIVIHGVGTTQWLRYVSLRLSPAAPRMTPGIRLTLIIQSAIIMVGLHLVEILLWAFAYLLVAADELGTLESAVYFSAVTFTTLGYGDITLSSSWRMLSGFEAINGIVLVGWTTAFLFAVLQRTWMASNNPTTRSEPNE